MSRKKRTRPPKSRRAAPQSAKNRLLRRKSSIELTKNQAALRDQVRQTLAAFQKQPFNTRQNTAGDIHGFLPALRLRHGNYALRRFRRTPRERHHLPVLELSLRRFRAADDERRPHRRPRRLRRAIAAFAILGHAGVRPGAGELSAARRESGPHRGRFGRVGKTLLPLGRRYVAETHRLDVLRRRRHLEKRLGRRVVAGKDRPRGIEPARPRTRPTAD